MHARLLGADQKYLQLNERSIISEACAATGAAGAGFSDVPGSDRAGHPHFQVRQNKSSAGLSVQRAAAGPARVRPSCLFPGLEGTCYRASRLLTGLFGCGPPLAQCKVRVLAADELVKFRLCVRTG